MELAVLLPGVAESIIYSVLWILLMVVCFLTIDKCTKFSLKKELIEDENVALWVMFAWFFVAVAIIISAAIK